MVSDDAGQFDIGQHALCWIHAERLVHKLDTFTDAQRAAQQHVRGLIWWFYADLKAYRRDPTPRRRSELRARFDRIFRRHHRLRHPRPPAAAAARQQGRAADGARPPRNPAAHQRLGKRHPLPGDQAPRQRRHPAPTSAATAATPSSASPRPAASSASPSGTTSATGSVSSAARPSRASRTSSAAAQRQPDTALRPGFCPGYARCGLLRSRLSTNRPASRH